MQATYRALCEHGYADLTMQRIADESSLSKAAFHYHFDTKEDLLNAFLDYLLDRFEERLACEASDPRQRLDTFIDAIFSPPSDDDGGNGDGDDDFAVALMEIKSQAPFHDAYRERLTEMDDLMRAVVTSAIADGIDAGHFTVADDVDPEAVSRFVVTAINGSHARQVALGEDPTETQRLVERYLEQQLGRTPGVVA
jgi:AcrR family transcriptional regulator